MDLGNLDQASGFVGLMGPGPGACGPWAGGSWGLDLGLWTLKLGHGLLTWGHVPLGAMIQGPGMSSLLLTLDYILGGKTK